MKHDVTQQAKKHVKRNKNRKRWYRISLSLALIVGFCTIYALSRPASTMEKGQCDIPEHTHDASCYKEETITTKTLVCTKESLNIHTHTKECYNDKKELICGYADYVVHTHDSSCYDENGKLCCSLPEIKVHTHSNDCYIEISDARSQDLLNKGEPLNHFKLRCKAEENRNHQHTEACYDLNQLLDCDEEEIVVHTHTKSCYDEDGNLVCGKLETYEHQHTKDCFETHEETKTTDELICGKEEHKHDQSCYIDEDADVETEEDWKATFKDVELSGDKAADLVAIAETQIGYTESTSNYQVLEDGTTIKGYTRYGQWYGNPYGDWDAMFVSFCLHYADIGEISSNDDSNNWVGVLKKNSCDRFEEADGYDPKAGDLIFFDTDEDGKADHVGIIAEISDDSTDQARIRVIEGDSEDAVRDETYYGSDESIMGYGRVSDIKDEKEAEEASETNTDNTSEAKSDEEEKAEKASEETKETEENKSEGVKGELAYEGPDYRVHVSYKEDAGLPEDVKLVVKEIPQDSEEYNEYYEESLAAVEEENKTDVVVFARFFDISFELDGKTIEPKASVEVTITYDEAVETGKDVTCQSVHFAEDGLEILDVETDKPDKKTTSFTHTQDSFSPVGTVVTKMSNPTDIGPDKLQVDYYINIDNEWLNVGTTKTGWYGDYETDNSSDINQDYITLAQIESILGEYGFDKNGTDAAMKLAYQRKDTYHADLICNSRFYEKENQSILTLSKESSCTSGYNIYYLPGNTDSALKNKLDDISTKGSVFYTVKAYDSMGELLKSEVVLEGNDYTYQSPDDTQSWIVSHGNTTEIMTGSSITIEKIAAPVTIAPNKVNPKARAAGTTTTHTVTYKALVNGKLETVGTSNYYYSGTVNGSQRAYITSDMAAQYFGKYGYSATTDPEYHFGYSYNDIYHINYSGNTDYRMDISGGKIENNTAIQLWTANSSDAQIFRIWDSGEGYKYITPVGNSSYHVNVLGDGTKDGTKLVIHTATDEASHWKVVNNSDGTVSFYNKNAPDSAVIDLPNGDVTKENQLHIWSNGVYRNWKLEQLYRISNNTVSESNSDGTYKIGLTEESNGDIVCYYLPGETAYNLTNASESDIVRRTANNIYSVKVVDDTHSVYSDNELNDKIQYVQAGGSATVTVRNASDILWSCQGKNGGAVDSESSQSSGYTTFTIKNITQPIEVVATKANPSFTVQYYGNIPRFAASGDNALKVIDTSGKQLPTNGGSMATRSLYLEGTGQNTNQNKGDATQLYRVKTTTELTKLYTENKYEYQSSPGLEYFNKLKDNESYTLKEIWILKTGKNPSSTARGDWNIYTDISDITFTNEASQAGAKTILIQEGMVIRLVSDSSNGDYYNDTTFYDYDISSGQNSDGRWRTGITGINSESNYGTSLNGVRNWRSGADILAFGNANCGTGMSGYLFDGGPLNKYNSKNSAYGGATFKLASGLNDDGTIKYNGYIVAPKLFNDGDATGKQTYSGSNLTFNRVGDTYTLSSATLKNSNGKSNTLSGLQYFFNPSPTSGTTHTHIFTNNFWPMDQAAGKTDVLWGEYGSPGTYQGFTENNNYNWGNLPGNFPVSDDGNNHNWFFGMNFSLNFNLTADYVGPLEYYFFGDDDLWVFLDGKLICDIGGVHSSIGEFVNLRDYLPVGSSGQHTLSFFYTERGASGSTCYMSFTLPSVSAATTTQDTGSLQIGKKVEAEDGTEVSNQEEEYRFKVELLTKEYGTPLNQTFSYSKSDGTYGTVKSGGTIVLKADETATISGIPAGTYYKVTELTTDGYKPTVNGKDGYIASGTIENGRTEPANFVNKTYCELPQTGGFGTIIYTVGGLLFAIIAGLALMYRFKKRRREA
ncbi:MAG: fibro-slime domain-containing protein [Oliverpabstia intestinalis]|nr:fibro-slime domain-containing protein [Oliverpabstia intestinalis]MDD6411156.1 fibro-slime domain-containing protein [Oliverpabstia intestinalis]